MKYLIVEATSARVLQEKVQQHIDEGCPLRRMAQARGVMRPLQAHGYPHGKVVITPVATM